MRSRYRPVRLPSRTRIGIMRIFTTAYTTMPGWPRNEPAVGHGSCREHRRMEAATPIPPADTATEKAPMDALVIQGGRRLSGRVAISGAKNAALPVMAATLLAPGVHRLRNVPDLLDTRTFARVLEVLGAKVTFQRDMLTLDTTGDSSD